MTETLIVTQCSCLTIKIMKNIKQNHDSKFNSSVQVLGKIFSFEQFLKRLTFTYNF